MNSESKYHQNQSQEKTSSDSKLSWEKKEKTKGIFELLQPILGNFVLLIEEEKKRTLDKLEKAKKTLEKVKNSR